MSTKGNQFQQSQSYDSSKKLQDELQELGITIKHHEGNIKYFKALANKLDAEILVATGNTNTRAVKGNDAYPKDVIINNIIKYENTAAALFCQMKYKTDMSQHSLLKDVIGVVATLATTDDDSLSSILSEYLGIETMLAVVCKTSEGVKGLESYNDDGSIDKTSGVHAFAADVMGSLDGRFKVICLDDLRLYAGTFIADDPQRRLDLVKPILQGKTPTGFLGFAVNMISIDSSDMNCMLKAGNTLRETLFYNLFSSLQVYKSREDMLKARSVISIGAVSLDGGVIGRNGVFFLGHQKRDVDIKFPIRPSDSIHSEDYYENENKKETKWKKNRAVEDLQREQELLDRAKYTYELKKQEFVNFLSGSSTPR